MSIREVDVQRPAEEAIRAAAGKPRDDGRTKGLLASLKTYFGALGRRRTPREALGPRAIVDESVELMTLLIGRGVDLPPGDVATVLKASRDFEKEEWTPEDAAAVAICHAKMATAARPATLASLRYARSGARKRNDLLLIGFTILGLLLIFVLQFQSVQITDIGFRTEESLRIVDLPDTQENEVQLARPQAVAQIDRLRGIPFLDYFISLPVGPVENEPAQRAILAEARAWADALNTLILPALYGMLGAIAFILRNHPMNVRHALLTGDITGEYFIRMVLGLVSGITIGLFVSPDNVPAAGDGDVLAGFATVTPVALAFLSGYAVDLLFGIMDRIVAPFTTETSSSTESGARRTSS